MVIIMADKIKKNNNSKAIETAAAVLVAEGAADAETAASAAVCEGGFEQEKKDKKREARLEIIVAVFLGITALLTAWASWIGSLHGGNQATNYTKSNNMAADGNARYNEAAQSMMQDMILWNDISDLQTEILYYHGSEEDVDVEKVQVAAYKLYYRANDNLGERMAAQIGWDAEAAAQYDNASDYVVDWIFNEPNATVSPFYDDAFVSAYFDDSLSVLAEAEDLLETGMKDNSNGDAFGLVTVIYSVVLFLLGIAGTFKRIPNRMIIVIVSLIGLLIGAIYMFTLPMPTGFSLSSFFGG